MIRMCWKFKVIHNLSSIFFFEDRGGCVWGCMQPHNYRYLECPSYTLTHLTCIMALFTSGAETAGRQNENLFCDCVDLPHALVVVDHGHLGLSNPQGNWTGCKTDDGEI